MALRADPDAPHQIVWGVWSGCQHLSQSDKGRQTNRYRRVGGGRLRADGYPPGVSAEHPVPKSPQTLREWAEWQPRPTGGRGQRSRRTTPRRDRSDGLPSPLGDRGHGNSLLPGPGHCSASSTECHRPGMLAYRTPRHERGGMSAIEWPLELNPTPNTRWWGSLVRKTAPYTR